MIDAGYPPGCTQQHHDEAFDSPCAECQNCGDEVEYAPRYDADEDGIYELPPDVMCEACEAIAEVCGLLDVRVQGVRA